MFEKVFFDDDPAEVERKRREYIETCFDHEYFNEKFKEIDANDLSRLSNLISSYEYQVVEKMKLYILDNYEKVTIEQWNSTSHSIPELNKDKDDARYFGGRNYWKNKGESRSVIDKVFKALEESTEEIETIDFVYDFSDADFSCKINGRWAFIGYDTIKSLYWFVYNTLEKK